jgi:hypothetical protein
MSTATAEARARCAARLWILHRPVRSPRIRAIGIYAELLNKRTSLGASERSENSRGGHVCSRSRNRASIGRIRRRTESVRAASRYCQDLLDPMTIDCCACMEKENTPGTADATGVIVGIEPVSDNGCRHSNDRALRGDLRCSFKRQARNLPGKILRLHSTGHSL